MSWGGTEKGIFLIAISITFSVQLIQKKPMYNDLSKLREKVSSIFISSQHANQHANQQKLPIFQR